MDQAVSGSASTASVDQEPQSLSYKFQRLREKLRAGIASGELVGKLPGERALAKRFHVNAKTLSKALTDLAAEGLLDRSIGRGTYVKGSAPSSNGSKRCLVICDPAQLNWEIIGLLRATHPELETVTDVSSLRPSFLNQFNAVIDLASETPDTFIRDLVVRNVSVVVVGKEPKIYSTHAVVFDGPMAVAQAGRQLLLNGHRKLAAVEPEKCNVVADNLRLTVPRYAADADIQSCLPQDAPTMVDEGITAFVCHSADVAAEVKSQLGKAGISVPHQVSVVAVGSVSDHPPVSGFFIKRSEKANAIAQLLRDQQSSRPTTIWLAGQFVDRGTLAPPYGSAMLQPNAAEGSAERSLETAAL